MFRRLHPLLKILLLCSLPWLLSACALRALFGNVFYVESFNEEYEEFVTTVAVDSSAVLCEGTEFGFFDCAYFIDGEIVATTLYLLSEFGVLGILIDPVIVQIPEDVNEISATYDTGSGPQPLYVNTTDFFHVTPSITVTAEANHKFLVLELPPNIEVSLPTGDPRDGLEVTYALAFTQSQPSSLPAEPVAVKVLLAGKAIINEHAYYVPMLPCETEFANIPAVEIPLSQTPVNLQPAVGDLVASTSNSVCDHEAYTFNAVPPPPKKVFLPAMNKR